MSNRTVSNKPTFKQLELSGWDTKAGDYHDLIGGITQQAAKSLLAAANIKQGTQLLDVATGPGYIAATAFAQGAVATGVDFAPGMVTVAKQNYPDINFLQGDAEALEFSENRFDVVTCGFGLLHLAEPEKAIAEAFRVLRPGGSYLFTVWASPDKHEFFGLVLNAIETHGTLDLPLPPAPPFFRFSDPAECETTLNNTGFADTQVTEIPLYWEPTRPEDVITLLEKSSVRAAMLLEMQTPEASEKIKQAILVETAQFNNGGCYRIAWPAVLVAARKPG